MNHSTVVGLDIAKSIFHIVMLDSQGRCIQRKKLRRQQLRTFFVNLPQTLIAMEGCASSHYWAREFNALGHRVKLLPAQYVKAYLRGNKQDYNDALAIAEAARVPEMREVTVKTVEQQSIQSLHRLRAHTVANRTALCNQIRGLLAEFGIVEGRGISRLRHQLPRILEDAETALLPYVRDALALKYEQLLQLDELIQQLTASIQQETRHHAAIQRLQSIPGFGFIVASVFYSVFGSGKQFKRGRDLSAALGIVPKQHSSGNKQCLLGISKRGDKYLRSLLIHGARSVLIHAHKKEDALSVWVTRLVERRGKNKATVALANKLARIAWAVLTQKKTYQANYAIA